MTARGIIMAASGGSTVPLHRYWRIYITRSQYNSVTSIGEVAFRSAVGGADIIAGGTASASSVYDPYDATRAHDGNVATYWASNTYANIYAPTWWQYDFGPGRAADVVELVLRCSTAILNNPTAFSLDWSDDGITWNTRKNFTTSDDWTTGETRVFSLVDSPLHRLWRVLINVPEQAHIGEIEYHTAIGGLNIIAGGGASSSSFFSGVYFASNAVDGNPATAWMADPENPNPNWWKYAFVGSGVSVVELAITSASYGTAPTSFSLQWSDNDLAWTTYKSFTTPATWVNGEKRVFS